MHLLLMVFGVFTSLLVVTLGFADLMNGVDGLTNTLTATTMILFGCTTCHLVVSSFVERNIAMSSKARDIFVQLVVIFSTIVSMLSTTFLIG